MNGIFSKIIEHIKQKYAIKLIIEKLEICRLREENVKLELENKILLKKIDELNKLSIEYYNINKE